MRRAALAARIEAFIVAALGENPLPESFETLAIDVHSWQSERCRVARRLSPAQPPRRVEDLPAVPVALFRDLNIGAIPDDEVGALFRTSGTTGARRGVHRLRDTALYDRGALGWASAYLGSAPGDIVALLTDPTVTPDSSLSHMVADFVHFGKPARTTWHLVDGQLHIDSLTRRMHATRGPVFLAATSFSLDAWLAAEPLPLPEGSVVMVTGGFKGRTRRLSDEDLFGATRRVLAPARIVTEYGMTELSSQLWGDPGGAYHPPPWLRAVAADPFSGQPCEPGVSGQLRFYDLCNLDSAVGIETMDEGVVREDGSVLLSGRLSGAPPRGCSLTVRGS